MNKNCSNGEQKGHNPQTMNLEREEGIYNVMLVFFSCLLVWFYIRDSWKANTYRNHKKNKRNSVVGVDC